MSITAAQILSAIDSGELDATSEAVGFEIVIQVGGQEVGRVGCHRRGERPKAIVFDALNNVLVLSSPGLPEGFSIGCETHEEAVLIAKAIDECLQSAHLDLAPDR